ncbi:MAG: class I SAM-dependent methyltransferase [Alphaproteobacteria bacterium]|nr:class I SAM-dependent methyltransferase [Alphaproteobacteria bacterium]
MTQDGEKKLAGADPDELLARAYAVETPDDSLALYKDWADTYDQHLEQGLQYLSPTAVAAIFAEYVPNKSAITVDIGCGTGLTGLATTSHGYQTLDGIDISPDMLREAGKKGLYRELIQADLTGRLEIADETYDAAISSGTFTHAHVGAGAFDEIFRILKPGAIFACTINADVWVENGFGPKIRALTRGGVMHVREIRPGAYFKGDDAVGRFLVFQKC